MPAYKFEALDAGGKSTTGLLDAENAKAARAQLRAQSLVPLEVTQVASAGTTGTGLQFKRKVFNSTSLTVWTRQLSALSRSCNSWASALLLVSAERLMRSPDAVVKSIHHVLPRLKSDMVHPFSVSPATLAVD